MGPGAVTAGDAGEALEGSGTIGGGAGAGDGFTGSGAGLVAAAGAGLGVGGTLTACRNGSIPSMRW